MQFQFLLTVGSCFKGRAGGPAAHGDLIYEPKFRLGVEVLGVWMACFFLS